MHVFQEVPMRCDLITRDKSTQDSGYRINTADERKSQDDGKKK